MALTTAQLNEQLKVVKAEAAKAGVPWEILWGVYGVETTHGANVSTSSAGAEGAFQFLKSTAAEWKYPYTNQQTPQIFASQAASAANYLSSLKGKLGSWDAALKAYSGGGYGEKQVLTAARGDATEAAKLGIKGIGSIPIPLVGEVVKGSPLSGLGELGPGFSWEKLGTFALTSMLLLVGAVLVVYGIIVTAGGKGSKPVPVPVPV